MGVARLISEDEPDAPALGVLRWLVSCDESGVNGDKFYGFGTLWMNWQRRGEFSAIIKDLRAKYRFEHEFKWSKVSKGVLPFYRALVTEFFTRNWISFHCLLMEKAKVTISDKDRARRVHFTQLLTNKIRRCLDAHPGRDQTFRIWVDPIHSAYAKADEEVEVIANNVLARVFGSRRVVDAVITKDSKETPSIMLADVLLGAARAAWERDVTSPAKLELARFIAEHLGWDDLRSDTWRHERKFNVWLLQNPNRPRPVVTRPVRLRHPLPPLGARFR